MAAKLSDAEASVIKGLFTHYGEQFTNQEILSKFSVPARTVNAGRISEIKNGHERYESIPTATKDKVDKFLSGEIKLHHLAGKLFPMQGTPQFVFDMIEYDPVTLEVNTPEGSHLDYKEIYDQASLPVYLKILAGMVNAGQKTGSVVFGVSDAPPKIVGVSDLVIPSQIEKWRDVALSHFEPFLDVRLEKAFIGGDKDKQVIVAKAQFDNAPPPPIICRNNWSAKEKGVDKPIIKEGAVYYRYGDSTRDIRYADLRVLIDRLKNGG